MSRGHGNAARHARLAQAVAAAAGQVRAASVAATAGEAITAASDAAADDVAALNEAIEGLDARVTALEP